MSVLGLTLVLSAALCHATWNLCVKRINGGPELIWLFSLVSVVLYLPLALWILLTTAARFDAMALLFIFGSAVLHLGYFLLLQKGYQKGDLSLVYPIARATGPVLATAFAVVFLSETLTAQTALGAAIIIFGVLMLTGGIKRGQTGLTTSLAFGLGAGTLIGSYTAWDAYAVSVLLIPPLLLDYTSSLGRLVLLAPVALRHKARMLQHWTHHRGAVLTIGVFNPLAYILVLYALTFTPVTLVAPLREISVLLTVLAGSVILGEGDLPRRLGWAAVILTGMTLVIL